MLFTMDARSDPQKSSRCITNYFNYVSEAHCGQLGKVNAVSCRRSYQILSKICGQNNSRFRFFMKICCDSIFLDDCNIISFHEKCFIDDHSQNATSCQLFMIPSTFESNRITKISYTSQKSSQRHNESDVMKLHAVKGGVYADKI